MRKSSDVKAHYRPGTSRGGLSLVTFREQMTDFARGDRLLELRAEKRMSREDVAHAVGVTTKSLYTWEKKSGAIKSDNAKQLAKFYGVKVWEELVTRDPTATGPSSRGQVGEGFTEFRSHVADIRSDIAELRQMLADARTERENIRQLLDTQEEILEDIKRVAAGLPKDESLRAVTAAARRAVELGASAAESPGETPSSEREMRRPLASGE